MPHAPLRWFEDPDGWDGRLPAAFLFVGNLPLRAILAGLVARALRCEPGAVAVEHRDDAPPRVVHPPGSGLVLSAAGRGVFGALAIADRPVGVDVEVVHPAAEIPWRVLHPEEAAGLARLAAEERAKAFARLWSLKEAYVKALGTGFGRDPAAFAVRFLDERRARIDDPGSALRPVEAVTTWRAAAEGSAAFACVILGSGAPFASPGG